VAQTDIEFVVINVMQKHIHTSKIVGGVVNLLSEETLFNNMCIKLFFGLQQQRTRTASRIVDFIDCALSVQRQSCNQLGYILWRKKFTARLTCIGSIIGNQKLVSITEEINLIILKMSKI